MLTDGPDNPPYWEHALGRRARSASRSSSPRDLELRGDRAAPRRRAPSTSSTAAPNADALDTDGRAAARARRARPGTLGVVNAFGTGVADDKLAHAYVEDMVRFYLGEEPLLRSVPTFDLGAARARSSGRSTRSTSW